MNRPEIRILEMLESAGFEAYFVGGCVRDACLRQMQQEMRMQQTSACDGELYKSEGKREKPQKIDPERERSLKAAAEKKPTGEQLPAGDVDVTTNALPHQIKAVFDGWDVIETGIQHGTVTVLLAADHLSHRAARIPVEITTYRVDGDYSDSRHPDRVKFVTSLTEDLRRRDFTINAMACDLRGEVKDPFGGLSDLRGGILRAVGDPALRFREDALRIMRGVRFAAVLGFEIEAQTRAAMQAECERLQQISAERVYGEFRKLVAGTYAADAIRSNVDVLAPVLPELAAMKGFRQNNPYHKYDVLEHCIRAMEVVETTPDNHVYLKMAALFHDIGKPLVYSEDENGIGHFYGHPAKSKELTDLVLTRLRADHKIIDRVGVLVKYHDLIFERDPRLLKRWMHRLGPDVMQEILEIKLADNIATGNISPELKSKFQEIRCILEEILAEEQCFSLKDLAVYGGDLMGIGIKPGPQMGQILEQLLEDVIEERLPNDKQVLLDQAKALADLESAADGGR